MEQEKGETQEEVKQAKTRWLKKEALSTDAFIVALAILLGAIVIALAINSPQMGTGKNQPDTKKNAVADDQALKETGPVTVSLDDDAVLGDKSKAKVAIVEFSDLECPFCKRFHQETYDQIVKEYVETGKAIMVARDFPLSFHDPKATEEAAVAECVRDQKNDAAYFAFTKDIYANTLTNGKGLPEGKMMELLKKAGVDANKAIACSELEATKQEITQDIADATKAGVTGTPSFVIGTLNEDGSVTGELVVGALPLSGFQEVVNKYLQ